MSALALILAKRGYSVSGSDPKTNENTHRLKKEGITIFNKQTVSNIEEISRYPGAKPLIIISSAISQTNPEFKAALKANLVIWHRSDLLALLINSQESIAVAGTHGKTTTSTLITTLLALTDQDPTSIIGGIVPTYGSNAHAGNGPLLIAEADESDGTLVKFKANLGIITNLELDHTDHYSNINELINTIQKFAIGCKKVLANYDCSLLRKKIKPFAWWSIKTIKEVDFAAIPTALNGCETIAKFYEKEKLVGEINLPISGEHNLSNAIAAIAACRLNGLEFEKINGVISNLKPPDRRFHFRGDWNGRQVVDDYAHHPSEINATISIARLIIKTGKSNLPNKPKRIMVVFQPHRYSRTKQFMKEFAKAIVNGDIIILAPIYSAGETPIPNINNNTLKSELNSIDPNLIVKIAEDMDSVIELIKTYSLKDDLVLTMGAGDITKIWNKLQNNSRKDYVEKCKATLKR